MLAYFFPPLGGIASLRAWRFATHLPEMGWEPVVVAPRHGDYYEDPGLTFREDSVVRTLSFEPSRAIRPSLRRVEPEAQSSDSPLDPLRRFVRRWIYRPDPQVGWYPFALAAARKIVRDRHVDAIFSSSFPVTGHLVARRLRREAGLPWVAEFRDLWSDWAVHGEARRRRDEALERSLLAEATAVVTVSPTYAEVFRKRGARHVAVVTNGFDERLPSVKVKVREAALTYLGTYYPGRQDLETALLALSEVRANDGRAPLFRIVGKLHPALAAVFRGLVGRVELEVTGFVPEQHVLGYLRQSQVLLLAGPVSCETAAMRGNVAAKTFEYLAARRPILMVGAAEADVAGLLRPFRHVRVVAPGDVAGARYGLESLRQERAEPDPEALEPFESRSLTRRLSEVLTAATGPPLDRAERGT